MITIQFNLEFATDLHRSLREYDKNNSVIRKEYVGFFNTREISKICL